MGAKLEKPIQWAFVARLATGLVSGIAVFLGSAYAHGSSDTIPLIQFSIKPRICVLSGGEEECRDEIEIRWSSETRRSLCLHQSDKSKVLRCWNSSFNGEHFVEISATQNIDFQLKEKENNDVVVTEAFEVVLDNSKYRRRRRNAWSFF